MKSIAGSLTLWDPVLIVCSLQRGHIMNQAKAAFFDSETQSDWSSKEYTAEELGKIERIFEAAGIERGLSVLEPGCGSGRLTKLVSLRLGDRGQVFASDISSRMMEQAVRRVEGSVNVRFFMGAIENANIGMNSFDVVLCHNVFPHFDDKPLALRKLKFGLKPTGRLIISHFMNSSEINSLHRKVSPAVASDFLPGHQEMKTLFEAAGLSIEYILDDEQGYLLKATPEFTFLT